MTSSGSRAHAEGWHGSGLSVGQACVKPHDAQVHFHIASCRPVIALCACGKGLMQASAAQFPHPICPPALPGLAWRSCWHTLSVSPIHPHHTHSASKPCRSCCAFCCGVCQVRAREEELLNLTSLHTATKAAADKRIAALEMRVTKLLEANRCAKHSCILKGGQ